MTHTAELLTEITPWEYKSIMEREGQWERDGEGRVQYHIRALEPYGITDIKPKRAEVKRGDHNFLYYYCSIVINLQRIVNGGRRSIETYDNENNFATLIKNFGIYMSDILPQRSNLNEWNLQRIDYNIDIKLTPRDVNHYIILLQRGGKGYSWKTHELASEKKRRQQSKHGQRKITHPTGSVLYDNKQYSINIYDKHKERLYVQQKRGITDVAELEASEGVLRIEVQVKKNKLKAIKKYIDQQNATYGNPLGFFARYDIAIPIIMGALGSITGSADYVSYRNALRMIEKNIRSFKTQRAIVEFLSLVTRTRSVWRAKELFNTMQIDTVLGHLKRLNINPVTIPTSFGCDMMENLYNIVAVRFAEQREGQENQ